VFTEIVKVEINAMFSCLYLTECSFLSHLFNESLILRCGGVWYLVCFMQFGKSISVVFITLDIRKNLNLCVNMKGVLEVRWV